MKTQSLRGRGSGRKRDLPGWPAGLLALLAALVASPGQEQERTVRAEILDAATRQPVQRFTVLFGYDFCRAVSWDRKKVYVGRGGKLDLPLAERPNYLKILADGCQPEVSRHIRQEEGVVDLAFALKKAERFKGTLLATNDTTLYGAQVALVTESMGVDLAEDRLLQTPGMALARTDIQGRFSFVRDPEALEIVAAVPQGFIRQTVAEVAAEPKLLMRPWAKVEGTLPGAKAAGGQGQGLVVLTAEPFLPALFKGPCQGRVGFDFQSFARELAAGQERFEFKAVLPGRRTLWHSICIDDRLPAEEGNLCFAGQPLDLKAGETRQVALGASGFQMKGRITAPGKLDWSRQMGFLRLQTPGGPELEFSFTFGLDGHFRLDGLPLEVDRMELALFQPPIMTGVVRLDRYRKLSLAPQSMLDVQTLDLAVVKPARPGEPAPDFTVATLAGQPLQLADFRGRWVLLEFWAGWCNPTLSSFPHLRAAYDAFGKDARVAILSLNLDEDPAPAKRLAELRHLPGIQGWAGSWARTGLPARYAAEFIPAAFLVGPDGLLLEANLPGEQMAETLRKHLSAAK